MCGEWSILFDICLVACIAFAYKLNSQVSLNQLALPLLPLGRQPIFYTFYVSKRARRPVPRPQSAVKPDPSQNTDIHVLTHSPLPYPIQENHLHRFCSASLHQSCQRRQWHIVPIICIKYPCPWPRLGPVAVPGPAPYLALWHQAVLQCRKVVYPVVKSR